MRRWGIWIVLFALFCLPSGSALAQYEGTDAAYNKERREERAERRKWKLYAGLGAVVVFGGIAVIKKMRGKTEQGH